MKLTFQGLRLNACMHACMYICTHACMQPRDVSNTKMDPGMPQCASPQDRPAFFVRPFCHVSEAFRPGGQPLAACCPPSCCPSSVHPRSAHPHCLVRRLLEGAVARLLSSHNREFHSPFRISRRGCPPLTQRCHSEQTWNRPADFDPTWNCKTVSGQRGAEVPLDDRD